MALRLFRGLHSDGVGREDLGTARNGGTEKLIETGKSGNSRIYSRLERAVGNIRAAKNRKSRGKMPVWAKHCLQGRQTDFCFPPSIFHFTSSLDYMYYLFTQLSTRTERILKIFYRSTQSERRTQ